MRHLKTTIDLLGFLIILNTSKNYKEKIAAIKGVKNCFHSFKRELTDSLCDDNITDKQTLGKLLHKLYYV